MPEGDSIHRAARRVGAALVGHEIRSIETPQPRHGHDHWPERLSGRDVGSGEGPGKDLFLRFGACPRPPPFPSRRGRPPPPPPPRRGGAAGALPRGGAPGPGPPRRAWLVIRTD